jgi:uncharacterized protein (TIGR02646 family)
LIRITKPATVPAKLKVEGKKQRRAHGQAFTKNPTAYQTGTQKFDFADNIYAHSTVKEALIVAQHKKCCFCERIIANDGDVEHFRPKKAYRQKAGEKLQYPGYYWLAYEWDNLYLSCAPCNQRHKKNLFPLIDPHSRAKDHHHKISQEQPLLIDPGMEDPEDFIEFHGEMLSPANNNARAKATITMLKLNDPARGLPEARLQKLQLLKKLHRLIQLAADRPDDVKLQQFAKEAQDTLEMAVQDNAEFAAAARAALKDQFQYVDD